MAWIESHQSLRQHPKLRRFARALNISIPCAVGHMQMFWWWALDYAPSGALDRYRPEDIADAVEWEGGAADLMDALVVSGFVDEKPLAIHDWADYTGRLIEKREANARRMRERRATNVQRTTETREQLPNSNQTVQNQELQDQELPPPAAAKEAPTLQALADSVAKEIPLGSPPRQWLEIRGLSDFHNGLISKLQERDEKWRAVRPAYWVKLKRDFGGPILTMALQRLWEQPNGEVANPEGLIRAVCLSLAEVPA